MTYLPLASASELKIPIRLDWGEALHFKNAKLLEQRCCPNRREPKARWPRLKRRDRETERPGSEVFRGVSKKVGGD